MGRRSSPTSGFVLADVLAALVIAAIALSTILTGIGHAARIVSVQTERIVKLLEQENDRATRIQQIFTPGE